MICLSGYGSEWFNANIGVKQDDTLSTTLFSLHNNDLIYEIKLLRKGVKYSDQEISILCYACDISHLVNHEMGLQDMLKGWY